MSNILHIISSPSAGGAEVYVREVAFGLKRRGHQIHIGFLWRSADIGRSTEFEAEFLRSLDEAGIQWFVVGYECRRRPWLGIHRVRAYCRKHDITHYHAHLVYGLLFGATLSIPRFYTEHSGKVRGPRLLRLALKHFADVHIGISRSCAAELQAVLNVTPAVIFNGVDPAGFPLREPRLGAGGRCELLAIGRVWPPKNYPLLVEAISSFSTEERERIRLRIVGDGEPSLVAQLQSQIATCGLDDVICFVGLRRDVAKLMAEADLLVMSSSREGLPITLLEATMVGLPFVATDVGGCRELSEMTGGGIIVPPGDAGHLARAINRLVKDPAEREFLSQRSALHRDRFSIRTSVAEHERLYLAHSRITASDQPRTPSFFVMASSPQSLVNFRGPLLKALRDSGGCVMAAAPAISIGSDAGGWLEREGIASVDVQLDRTGLNPLADLKLFLRLVRLFRQERPAVVLGYTIKPVIYGTIAAWIAGVPRRYALITGLGYAFIGEATGKRGVIQRTARFLYRAALFRASGVIFQNGDDAALFAELGLLRQGVPVHVVNGSGVDLDHYCPQPLPGNDNAPTFLLVARLLSAKGIREYAAAASQLKRDRPDARFMLVGGHDSNPDAIAHEELQEWVADGSLEWHGQLEDVRVALGECHVFVLPSYREGTPRSVLEAMATGRAIITTDAPGCRETVVEGENGYLVPVRDADALAAAMRRFLDDPTLAARMGQRSLEIAREKFDVRLVNQTMLRAMGIAA